MSTFLTYDLVTDPDPLQVSYTNAKLTVIASNSDTDAVAVQAIQIAIPYGTGSASLSLPSSSIHVAVPNGWVLTDVNDQLGQYTFSVSGRPQVTGGFAFVFTGLNINDMVGTATVGILETQGSGDIEPVNLPVSKFPAEFELGPLVANPAALSPGGMSTLSWDGSAGYHYSLDPVDLLANGPIDGTLNNSSATTVPLVQNAVFTLTVTNAGGSAPFVTSRSVGVTVAQPMVEDFTLNGANRAVTCDMGTDLTFAWTASNADYILLMAGNTPVGLFAYDQREITIQADRTAKYWIVAYYGPIQLGVHSAPSQMFDVTLNPPQIVAFGPTMANVYADYDASALALTWTVKNATSLLLQLGEGEGTFPVDLSTTRYPITPSVSTQYTLIATYDPDEVPTSAIAGLAAPAGLAFAAETAVKTSVSAQSSVDILPCPVEIATYTFNPISMPWTHSLSHPIGAMAWGIAGFDYSFADGDKHNLNVLGAYATTTVQGQSFTMTPNLQLSNDSGKDISSSSKLTMVSFVIDQGNATADAGETNMDWQNLSVTFDGTNYADIQASLAGFNFSSESGSDGKVSSITARIAIVTPHVNTVSGQTSVTVTATGVYGGAANGVVGEESYYWGIQSGVLGRRSAPEGSGFAMKLVDQNTATVDFDHPVVAAYTMLTEWMDTGTKAGDNHTIKRLRSDCVNPTCDNTTRVTLDWGQAYWDDGKYDPWPATRQIILIAVYGASR